MTDLSTKFVIGTIQSKEKKYASFSILLRPNEDLFHIFCSNADDGYQYMHWIRSTMVIEMEFLIDESKASSTWLLYIGTAHAPRETNHKVHFTVLAPSISNVHHLLSEEQLILKEIEYELTVNPIRHEYREGKRVAITKKYNSRVLEKVVHEGLRLSMSQQYTMQKNTRVVDYKLITMEDHV